MVEKSNGTFHLIWGKNSRNAETSLVSSQAFSEPEGYGANYTALRSAGGICPVCYVKYERNVKRTGPRLGANSQELRLDNDKSFTLQENNQDVAFTA